MKIAIVHDYIKEYGGAERVLEEFVKLFPEAEIYTSVYLPGYLGPHEKRFKNFKIHASFLQYFPFKARLISPFRLLAPLAFMTMDLSGFDVIIVSQTGAYFPNLVSKGGAKLICYTHTPPRYLYGYKTARDWKNNGFKLVAGSIMNHFLRLVDYHASRNVDCFIANSQEVAGRIKKFYRRDSVVIYPPVEIPKLPTSYILDRSYLDSQTRSGATSSEGAYLAGGRLARAKGTDIILCSFLKNKKPLKIFGKGFAGFEEELLEKIKDQKSNIEFVGEVTDEEKLELMRNAKAYVFASFDEDFGITPVEAMACGTPVIAFKSGGVQETVVDYKTGIFYKPNSPDSLNNAIYQFEKLNLSPDSCRKQAEKFSSKVFDKKIMEVVKKIVKNNLI